MYAGTTFRRSSGKIVGVHQKIDRVARKNLNFLISRSLKFPGIRSILHFEGKNGSDGLNLKGASRDVPWHFIDPTNLEDRAILTIINDHICNLADSLSRKDAIRSAFDAAWLAHAVTDGLTPAHHYPLNDKIKELFGKSHNERHSLTDKNIIRGKNRRDTLAKNWGYWGAGGVFMAHLLYEMGVATTVAAEKFEPAIINLADIEHLLDIGFEAMYMESIQKIYSLSMFSDYTKTGWTMNLATETKRILLPEIIRLVTLAWYYSVILAKDIKS